MGDGIGVDIPDVAEVGTPLRIRVRAPASGAAACDVTDAETNAPVTSTYAVAGEATVVLPRVGLFRVDVKAGGMSSVGDLVLAVLPGDGIGRRGVVLLVWQPISIVKGKTGRRRSPAEGMQSGAVQIVGLGYRRRPDHPQE